MEIYNDVYGIKEQTVDQLAHLVNFEEPPVPGIIFPEGGLDQLAQIINVLLKIELQGHTSTSDWRGDYWLSRTTDAVCDLGHNLEDDYDEQYWQEPDFKEYMFILHVLSFQATRALEIEQIILKTFQENAKLLKREVETKAG